MKNKKYKAAVIGCGRIGAEEDLYNQKAQPATHAAVYREHPKIELAGLADVNPKKLKKAGRYFPGAPLFLSAEEMFRKIKPDIVSIATQPDSHPELVRLAAKYKTKAILCEKPIAHSLREAKEMIKSCRKNNSLLFINHQRHFDPLLKKWSNKIREGLIGDIFQANAYYYNGLFNNGTHIIDLLRLFLGEVNWVRGFTNEKTSWKKRDKNVDALVVFKNGARVFLQSLTKNYGFFDFYFYGLKGSFAIKKLGQEIEYRKLIENKYVKNYYQLSDFFIKKGRPRNFFKEAVSHIVACLDGKEKPISTGDDGLAALKILLALRKSAEDNGKLIKIKC